MQHLSYSERAQRIQNPLAKQLLQLMADKKTNLALSADVTRSEKLLQLVKEIGPEICILKTHIDILEDFSPTLIKELVQLAKQNQFLILEDRKFADIGNTVVHQYRDGIYHIADWAELVTVHSLPGYGVIDGLKSVGQKNNRGCFLLAEMSSDQNLLNEDYVTATLNMAQQYPEFVVGFIAQRRLLTEPDFIYFTPGVSLGTTQDNLGQRYVNPEKAIIQNGTDIISVGRAVINAPSPVETAREFRQVGWQTYQQRCK